MRRRWGRFDPGLLERAEVVDQDAFYVAHRAQFQRGRFLRLRSPFEGDGNVTARMIASDDRRTAIAGWYQALNRPMPASERLRLRRLDPEALYRITPWPEPDDTMSSPVPRSATATS